MNPETNKFEILDEIRSSLTANTRLLRQDGTPVPDHWTIFHVGEIVIIKDYTFKVAYIGESVILFEPYNILPILTNMLTTSEPSVK